MWNERAAIVVWLALVVRGVLCPPETHASVVARTLAFVAMILAGLLSRALCQQAFAIRLPRARWPRRESAPAAFYPAAGALSFLRLQLVLNRQLSLPLDLPLHAGELGASVPHPLLKVQHQPGSGLLLLLLPLWMFRGGDPAVLVTCHGRLLYPAVSVSLLGALTDRDAPLLRGAQLHLGHMHS